MHTLSSDEIGKLLSLAREGEKDALGRLLAQYQGYLELIARMRLDHKLQARVSASDAVQETYVRATKGFVQFRGNTEKELLAWLRRILVSRLATAAAHHRAEKRDIALEQRLEAELQQSTEQLGRNLLAAKSVKSPSEDASGREQIVLLTNALRQLPEHYQEVILLRHLHEESFPEIARQLERTLDSTKNIWARALSKLRAILGDSGGTD